MLALIHDATIHSTVRPGGWFELPDGSRSSPAQDGWSNGDYRLATIQPADPVPEGKRVASTSVELIAGEPKYMHVLEDEPAPDLLAYTAQKRWEKEVGGTTVSGMSIHTDRPVEIAHHGRADGGRSGS